MVDLSVQIGNVALANPIMPASGTFSPELAEVIDLNRLGALVTKSITPEFRAGNPKRRRACLTRSAFRARVWLIS
jgi:dihydroorotate dehydrogenase (NAD+) catalytic subunit